MKLYKREFLNDKKGTAFLEVSAETLDNDCIAADLKLADCNRVINLEFGVWDGSKKTLNQRIKKLDRIISAATLLREFLKNAKV